MTFQSQHNIPIPVVCQRADFDQLLGTVPVLREPTGQLVVTVLNNLKVRDCLGLVVDGYTSISVETECAIGH